MSLLFDMTYGVMVGWGTNEVAITESDAFWRVFFRLGRGTLSALVLLLKSAVV